VKLTIVSNSDFMGYWPTLLTIMVNIELFDA